MTTSASFAGSYRYNLKTAQKLMENLAEKKLESSTLIGIRLNNEKFNSPLEEALLNLRGNYVLEKIDLIRGYLKKAPVNSMSEYWNLQEKLVMKLKAANCAEMSSILNKWLTKSGVDSFHASVQKMDTLKKLLSLGTKINKQNIDEIAAHQLSHDMVVVSTKHIPGEMIPIRDLTDKEGVFIADPWLNKIFVSIDEALNQYKTMFGIQKQDFLGVVSRIKHQQLTKGQQKECFDKCDNILKKKLEILEEIYNEKVKELTEKFSK